MRLKHDLRQEIAVITTQASGLFKAIEALPETEDAMQEAIDALSRQERHQIADYLQFLSQRCYQIHERARWLKRQFEEGL